MEKYQFNADSGEIKNIMGTDGVNSLVLLYFTLSTKQKELKEIKVRIFYLPPQIRLL